MAKAKSPKTKKSKTKESSSAAPTPVAVVAVPVQVAPAPKRSLLPSVVSKEFDSLKERVSTLERLVQSLTDIISEKK